MMLHMLCVYKRVEALIFGRGQLYVIGMYTRTYVHTYIRMYTHTYIHTYVYTYIHKYIHTYVYTYVHTYVCIHVHTYIHTYVYTYIHTYIRMYTHTYIHTYLYLPTHLLLQSARLLLPILRYLLMSLLGLVSMGLFLLFTTNGCILHAWMNLNAEIMMFADRHFYEVSGRAPTSW